MAFLARRMRAQDAEAEEEGGQNPGVVSLRQEDIDELMAEGEYDLPEYEQITQSCRWNGRVLHQLEVCRRAH